MKRSRPPWLSLPLAAFRMQGYREQDSFPTIKLLPALFLCECLALAAQFIPWLSVSRAPVGLVAALFAPGYAVLLLLLPGLTLLPLAVLSLPISMAMLVLTGTVLEATPAGVHPATQAAWTEAISIALLVVAWWLRAPRELMTPRATIGFHLTWRRCLFMAVSAVTLTSLVALAGYGLKQASVDDPPPYTEISVNKVTPTSPGADGAPRALITLAIANHEATSEAYKLQVVAHTHPGSTALLFSRQFSLPRNGTWQRVVLIPAACGELVEARLTLLQVPEVSRRVTVDGHCGAGVADELGAA